MGNSRIRKLLSGKRSKLEERVQIALASTGHKIEYEPDRLPFVQPSVDRVYIPDFKLGHNNYIEVKGRLTLEDRKKLIWVKEQHPEITLRIIFGNGKNKLSKKSKTTYFDWAEKNGFEAIEEGMIIPKKWFKNKKGK